MSTPASLPRIGRSWIALCLAALMLPLSGQAQIQLGDISFATPSSKARSLSDAWAVMPTNTRVALSRGVRSARFVGSRGGIAFGAVAEGEDGLQAINLTYDATQSDGQRLSVTIRDRGVNRQIPALIYDWQLVPIANFALTQDVSCFTLFGEVENPLEQILLESQGKRVINYHDAFSNTLLGLRLMQADILVFQKDACDLPKINRQYLFAGGENLGFEVSNNRQRYTDVQQVLRIASFRNESYTSYVICDEGQDVRFHVNPEFGVLVLNGHPYWHCWRRNKLDDVTLQAAEKLADDRVEEERTRDSRLLIEADMLKKWTADFEERRTDEILDEITSPKIVEELPQLSRELSNAVRQNSGINPIVYETLTKTMRYAAFFRHVKRENPDAYARFVETLKNVKVAPTVETPTIIIEPGGG